MRVPNAHDDTATDATTHALIAFWGKDNMQERLHSVRCCNKYEGFAVSMCKATHNYSWKQCRMKIKNLAQQCI